MILVVISIRQVSPYLFKLLTGAFEQLHSFNLEIVSINKSAIVNRIFSRIQCHLNTCRKREQFQCILVIFGNLVGSRVIMGVVKSWDTV